MSSWSWCRTIFTTQLEIRVSKKCLLHFWHSGIIVQILSSLGISFFWYMDFAVGYIKVGLLLSSLSSRLLYEEVGTSHIVETTISRNTLEDSIFVSTLFESCDSSRYVCKIRNTHYSDFLPLYVMRNCNSQCKSCDDESNNSIFKWFSKSSLILDFSVCQDILNISQIAIVFPRIWLQFSIQTWLNKYCRRSFFHSTYYSFCNSVCF